MQGLHRAKGVLGAGRPGAATPTSSGEACSPSARDEVRTGTGVFIGDGLAVQTYGRDNRQIMSVFMVGLVVNERSSWRPWGEPRDPGWLQSNWCSPYARGRSTYRESGEARVV